MSTPQSCLKTYKLNTGAEIPALGLGTWRSPDAECYNSVLSALKAGYKHIDTAKIYGNEEPVGRAINDFLKESGTPREELFITTKLWCTECKSPEKALRTSLKKLNLEYVDLYLTHWPIAFAQGENPFPSKADGSTAVIPFEEWNYLDTYKGMQKLVDLGLTKAIGISNYNIPKIERLLNDPEVKIVPACNQVELHPYLPQSELIEYCKSKGIVCECYSPLGSEGAPLLKEPALHKLGEKYGVSPACIAISWAVARDTVVLPKSVNPVRVESNLKIVPLNKEDVALINDISRITSKRIVSPNWGVEIFGDSAEY